MLTLFQKKNDVKKNIHCTLLINSEKMKTQIHKASSKARQVTHEEVNEYQKNGVVKLSGAFEMDWINQLREVTETALNNPGPYAEEYAKGGGRFFGDLDVAKRFPQFNDFIYNSGAADMMGSILKSRKINFFYDQLLVKEPGTGAPTPWHQDMPYWAISGNQIASIWLPMDIVDKEVSLKYVAGSHLWEAYNPHNFIDDSAYEGTGLPELPDIDAAPDKYELLGWDMKPGDCLVFQGMIVHGAKGNTSNNRRRAWATRWTGDDVRYNKRKGKVAIPQEDPGLSHGDVLDSDAFPVIWSA